MSKHFISLFGAFSLLSVQSIANAQPVRKLENVTTPAASECLSPEHAGLYGGFKNRCDFAVQYTWCVVDPGPDDWSSSFACVPGRKTNALDSVQAKATSANHTKGGKGVQWFACAYKRETATGPGPDGIWGPVVYELGIGLRGRCALRQYADPTTAPPKPVVASTGSPEAIALLNRARDFLEQSNYALGIPMLEMAAMEGSRAAKYELGVLYYNGSGVPKDRARAVKLFNESAAAGYSDAIAVVNRLAAARTGQSVAPPARQVAQVALPPVQPARPVAQAVPHQLPTLSAGKHRIENAIWSACLNEMQAYADTFQNEVVPTGLLPTNRNTLYDHLIRGELIRLGHNGLNYTKEELYRSLGSLISQFSGRFFETERDTTELRYGICQRKKLIQLRGW